MQLALIVPDIRSAHNVGSLFRTADGAGVARLYIGGVSPTPVDRFGRPRLDIAKVALGAESRIPWEYAVRSEDAIMKARADGYRIVALEQSDRSVDYRDYSPPRGMPIALVVGNEVAGIAPSLLALADDVIELPMRGDKESLNVSVAAGIALYALASRGEDGSAGTV